jgi:hypothetical protein
VGVCVRPSSSRTPANPYGTVPLIRTPRANHTMTRFVDPKFGTGATACLHTRTLRTSCVEQKSYFCPLLSPQCSHPRPLRYARPPPRNVYPPSRYLVQIPPPPRNPRTSMRRSRPSVVCERNDCRSMVNTRIPRAVA